jgi:Flp pilus assembly protein TadD
MSARAPRFKKFARAFAAAVQAATLCTPLLATARQGQTVAPARVAQIVEQVRRSPVAEDAYAQALALGYALFGEGRYEEAAQLFGALVEKRPSDASALYGDALATFNAGRAAEAEPLARRAVEAALAASGDAGAAARSSNGEDASGGSSNDTGAIERERKTRAADALVLLAVVVAVRGDDTAALKAAQHAVAVAPQNFDAQFTLGRALYGSGDDAGAARAFRAAVALRPEDARARFFLATALEHAGDDAGALAAYRELAVREPRAAEGHLGLGVLLLKRGGADTEEGERELSRALEINPDLYEARVALGRSLVARGRAAEAVEHLLRAARLAPANPEPHYQLSLAYRRLGRKEEAAAESEIVRRIHESRRATGSSQSTPPPSQRN